MRRILTGLAALALVYAVSAERALAQGYPIYPWCVDYDSDGGTNCYFATLSQCQAAASGNGGVCYQNPFFRGYAGTGAAPRRSSRRSRN
jgi:hypothetical protein